MYIEEYREHCFSPRAAAATGAARLMCVRMCECGVQLCSSYAYASRYRSGRPKASYSFASFGLDMGPGLGLPHHAYVRAALRVVLLAVLLSSSATATSRPEPMASTTGPARAPRPLGIADKFASSAGATVDVDIGNG